ncbi:MAG: IS1 family transposase [Bdellovibrionaceae bacterium]|nr:IS1 family transposase [Pseudobdellovibrionaceae bacterium]
MSLVQDSPFLPLCPSGCRNHVVRRGLYTRSSDKKTIQRFLCRSCKKSFSSATFEPCFRQKRRDINPHLFRLLTGGFSQRRSALDLQINRKTVVRKFIFLGLWAAKLSSALNQNHPPAETIEFDDLETSEHTKCKPLSVTLAVEFHSRRILGFRVAQMPAKGLLSHLAKKKYGPRPDERTKKRKELFQEIKSLVAPTALIKSDENPHYAPDVSKHFQGCHHQRFKGKRGCVTGQGELKKIGFDPLFSLNHTCAMMRANINRLFRRTWCTTKKKERLALHIALYALRHNQDLILKKPKMKTAKTI